MVIDSKETEVNTNRRRTSYQKSGYRDDYQNSRHNKVYNTVQYGNPNPRQFANTKRLRKRRVLGALALLGLFFWGLIVTFTLVSQNTHYSNDSASPAPATHNVQRDLVDCESNLLLKECTTGQYTHRTQKQRLLDLRMHNVLRRAHRDKQSLHQNERALYAEAFAPNDAYYGANKNKQKSLVLQWENQFLHNNSQ